MTKYYAASGNLHRKHRFDRTHVKSTSPVERFLATIFRLYMYETNSEKTRFLHAQPNRERLHENYNKIRKLQDMQLSTFQLFCLSKSF